MTAFMRGDSFSQGNAVPAVCGFLRRWFSGLREVLVREAAFRFSRLLTGIGGTAGAPASDASIGAVFCAGRKVSNKYRYRLMVKCRNNRQFRAFMADLLRVFQKQRAYAEVTVFADINPDMTL